MYNEQPKGYNDVPVQKVNKTNYERIREMSAQELADFLCNKITELDPCGEELCAIYNEATDCECEKILQERGLKCGDLTEELHCPIAMEWWLKQEGKQ